MKATSKIISVVLVLVMALSLFPASAFADGSVVVTAPLEESRIAVGAYKGAGADQAVIQNENENGDNAQNQTVAAVETAVVPTDDNYVEVGTANDLAAALASKAAKIRLTDQIAWVNGLDLDYDVTIDLGGKGKGLVFTGSGDAAITSSANAVLFNGNIIVKGDVAATEISEAVDGFKKVAAGTENGSVYLNGVYVKYDDEGGNAIFGRGVGLGSGLFSHDVSAYYGEDAASQYVFEQTESGMFDVTAKAAEPKAAEDGEGDEDADTGDEDKNADGKVVTVEGSDEANGIYVTVSGVNLPEGLRVEVKPVDNSEMAADEGEEVLFVVDITLYDEDNNEYEPNEDPNVPEVTVYIRHPALGNVEEGEAVVLYHIVKGEAVPVNSAEEVQGQNALEFQTESFSYYAATKKTTGSTGDVHYRLVVLDSNEFYIQGTNLVINYTGNMIPEAVSVLPYELATSGNYDIYTKYLLTTNPAEYDFSEPGKITIFAKALAEAPEGKFGVVFWYMDGDQRVYMVQPVIFANKNAVEGTGTNFKPDSPTNYSKGTFDVEMCDYGSVKVKLTDELVGFKITGGEAGTITYDSSNKKKIDIGGKQYNAGEYFTVEEYNASDPVGHEFVASKVLTLSKSLLKKIGYRDNIKFTVDQKTGTDGDFTLNIEPGITVADGLDDYIKGKNTWIKFIACEPIDYDDDGTLAIWIGGQKISHDYYSISNDHKTLWIYRNLLDQLKSNNSYTLKARLWKYEGGEKVTWYPATASFNILAAGSTSSKSPKTGDESNIALWAAVLVLSGGAVVALIPKKKKNK
ncbi:MAG: LPXTG cell wall anchor domain-containing protein [Oscillospiraceae bacterium]|nr:LPXTG cell wall anchor domain-containing protein [Oscillospiraceae bacterium]